MSRVELSSTSSANLRVEAELYVPCLHPTSQGDIVRLVECVLGCLTRVKLLAWMLWLCQEAGG